MSKHTPAPWKFERHTDDSQYFGNVIGYYTPSTIRTITCQLRYGTLEEQQANARLIAAAPDLLNAIKDTLIIIKQCGFGGSNARLEKRMEKYLAKMIELATGEGEAGKISPSAGPRTELVAESSDGPANSSEGKAEQKRTPGEPRIGSGDMRRTLRKLDGGLPGPRPFKDP